MGKYDAVASRALAQIEKKGAAVAFPGAVTGSEVYDPLTDTWSGTGPSAANGKAVQIQGDPDTLIALGLVGVDNITLLVGNAFTDDAGASVAFVPTVPMAFVWAGKTYTSRKIDDVAPDGTPIIYTVTGAV